MRRARRRIGHEAALVTGLALALLGALVAAELVRSLAVGIG